MLHLRGALLGLAMLAYSVSGQTPPANTPAKATLPAPTGTVPDAPGAATAKAPPAPVISPTQQAVTVNGEPIYEIAIQRALERVPPARRAEERPRLIAYLVDNLLIDQSLRAAGYKVEATEVEKKVSEMKAELKKVGKDFEKMLGELRVTEVELRNHIGADLRWSRYATSQATDKVLQDLFTTNRDMFDGTQVKARHILLTPPTKDDKGAGITVAQLREIRGKVEAEVEAGLARLPATTDKAGRDKARANLMVESFGKYAKEKSECSTKNMGGDVGWFQKIGFVVAPFSQAAFALAPYQMSEPVPTPFGYHLILVTERKPGREVKFEEVKEVVKEVYFDREHDRLAGLLRQRAKIDVYPAPK